LEFVPKGGYFSPIAIHRLIFARHNQERETHVAECESGLSRDLPRSLPPLVLDFPAARAAPGNQALEFRLQPAPLSGQKFDCNRMRLGVKHHASQIPQAEA
jgi:hypothetical protein